MEYNMSMNLNGNYKEKGSTDSLLGLNLDDIIIRFYDVWHIFF
jgi:hypothetical protein